VHGGANYSLERADGNRNVTSSEVWKKTIGPFLSYMIEYNLGLNDTGGIQRDREKDISAWLSAALSAEGLRRE